MKTQNFGIEFNNNIAKKIINNILGLPEGDVYIVVGDSGTGKTETFNYIQNNLINKDVFNISFSLEDFNDTNFILLNFVKKIAFTLKKYEKKIRHGYDKDEYNELKRILLIDDKEISKDAKEQYRKKLFEYIMFIDTFLQLNKFKIVFMFEFPKKINNELFLKLIQTVRYVDKYFKCLNVIFFYDENDIKENVDEDIYKKFVDDFVDKRINLNSTWNNYDIDNELIFTFLKLNKISNLNLIKNLMSKNIIEDKYISRFQNETENEKFLKKLKVQIEFLNFVLNYFYSENNELYKAIFNSIENFYWSKTNSTFSILEVKDKKNKLFNSKLEIFIDFFSELKVDVFSQKSTSCVANAILDPYDKQTKILFTSYKSNLNFLENLNMYMPILFNLTKPIYLNKKNSEYWFTYEIEKTENELEILIDILDEHNQIKRFENEDEIKRFHNLILEFFWSWCVNASIGRL